MAKNQANETENAGNGSARAPHDETGWDPLENEKEEEKKSESVKPSKRLNLVRFLQEKPQVSGIRVLLNAKYRTAVKTMAEWESSLADLLNKKTK
jgi:hypothetical protein